MATEQLTYDQLAERLGTTREAARAIVKRQRLPRSRTNDGKTLVAIDLDELRHKPLPARSPRGHQSVTETVATLKARIAELEAELVKAEERSAGHRADFERERYRTDQMVAAQDRLITELENLRALLQAAEQPATPQPASRLPPRPRMAMDARDRVRKKEKRDEASFSIGIRLPPGISGRSLHTLAVSTGENPDLMAAAVAAAAGRSGACTRR
jgi:uncharacterized membrane protein YccC